MKMTEKMDDMMDKKAGIPENGPRDAKIDKSRGLPPDEKTRAGRPFHDPRKPNRK